MKKIVIALVFGAFFSGCELEDCDDPNPVGLHYICGMPELNQAE